MVVYYAMMKMKTKSKTNTQMTTTVGDNDSKEDHVATAVAQ